MDGVTAFRVRRLLPDESPSPPFALLMSDHLVSVFFPWLEVGLRFKVIPSDSKNGLLEILAIARYVI